MPRYTEEWENLKPAARRPSAGTKGAELLSSVEATYRDLWIRAGFDTDPFLRTSLRQWAKAGWIDRAIDEAGIEHWSLSGSDSPGIEKSQVTPSLKQSTPETIHATNPLTASNSITALFDSSLAQGSTTYPPGLDSGITSVVERLAYLKTFAADRDLLYKSDLSSGGMSDCYVYSPDMQYRYAFARWWHTDGPLVLWVGVNPAKGDTELRRRPTLERCINWSRSWGAAGLVFANLFAARHNKPDELRGMKDPIGPYNDVALAGLDAVAWRTVVAWGGDGKLLDRPRAVAPLLSKPVCLGVTASGEPRHPLYVTGDTPLVPWSISLRHHNQ